MRRTVVARNAVMALDWHTGAPMLTLWLDKQFRSEAETILQEWRDGKQYEVTIALKRKRRSLDANAYCWHLIGQIADKIQTSKEEVYQTMLKRYGQGGVVKIPDAQKDIVLRQVQYWEPHEKLPPEEIAQYYRIWVGSSKYNTQEMSALIDGIVSEAKELGIQTMTLAELALLKESWRSKASEQSHSDRELDKRPGA